MRRTRMFICGAAVLGLLVILVGCGGGGGGGGSAPLSPPSYNVTGTWNVKYNLGTTNCTGVPSSMTRTYYITQTSGSNTIYIADNRSPTSYQAGTISANVVSFNGPMYPEFTCTDQTGNFSVTTPDGLHFSGAGTIYCNDAPGCSATISSMTGTKQ